MYILFYMTFRLKVNGGNAGMGAGVGDGEFVQFKPSFNILESLESKTTLILAYNLGNYCLKVQQI